MIFKKENSEQDLQKKFKTACNDFILLVNKVQQ